MSKKQPNIKITRGSNNVYKDLGFENHEELLKKAELTRKINNDILGFLNVSQNEFCCLQKGIFDNFSIERLEKISFKLKRSNCV